jgi:hypothetical protein
MTSVKKIGAIIPNNVATNLSSWIHQMHIEVDIRLQNKENTDTLLKKRKRWKSVN